MAFDEIDRAALIRLVRDLQRIAGRLGDAIEQAKKDRKSIKELVQAAEAVLTNHAQRISQNEQDIQSGKDKLLDHEQRITNLENA